MKTKIVKASYFNWTRTRVGAKEQRRARRHHVDWSVSIKGDTRPISIVNISTLGICIRSSKPFRVREVLRLSLEPKNLEVSALVLWTKHNLGGWQAGCRFMSPAWELQNLLGN